MPSQLNCRAYVRRSVDIKCRLSSQQEPTGRSANMSLGGVGLICESRFQAGTSLAVQYHLRDEGFLRLSGEVVYCREADQLGYAMGIKFTNVPLWKREVLGNLLQEFQQNLTAQHDSQLVLEPPPMATTGFSERVQSVDPHPADAPLRKRTKRVRLFTPDPSWVLDMDHALAPYRQQIWQSRLVQETASGELSLRQVQGWSIQFYPFIEAFPQFMATYLAKAPDAMSRAFLIDNLKVEKRHAEQWVDMAGGFGVSFEELTNTLVIAAVETLTHWLWSITSRGSFVESVSATNYAIEGVTQGIAKIMVKGFVKYDGKQGVYLNKKAYSWMEAHAHYDDLHPADALEIIKCHATTPELQRRVTHAAQRSLEYLSLALEACYFAYSASGNPPSKPLGTGIEAPSTLPAPTLP
jgi:pyrroloquinoline quinone (PQQ) biosynthesis protein C